MKYVSAIWLTFYFDFKERIKQLGGSRWRRSVMPIANYWHEYPVKRRFKNCLAHVRASGPTWTWNH